MTNEVKETQQENTPTPAKRKQHKAEKAEVKNQKTTWWVQIRLFPIWLRIVLVTALLIGAIAAGLIVGYGYVGDGNPENALKWDTWQHILDMLNGKES